MNYKLKNAIFLKSAQNIRQAPPPLWREVAFLGRSNVGKSSLINLLCNQKNLAKSSSTPGKTQLINYFELEFSQINSDSIESKSQEATNSAPNEISKQTNSTISNKTAIESAEIESLQIKLYFVDLPGFGYAKVSKTEKYRWERDLSEFLYKREAISLFIHLIDSRHPQLSSDTELGEFLQNFLRPNQRILKIYTKCDKLKKSDLSKLKSKATTNAELCGFSSTMDKNCANILRNLIIQNALGF